MKHFFFTAFSFVVIVSVIFISQWNVQAQELENAACIIFSSCRNDCLVFQKIDSGCSSGSRCVAIQCFSTTVGFQYCVQSSGGNTCEKSGTINVTCQSCTQWTGDCSNDDPDCSEVPTCGDPGGTSPHDYTLAQSCV